MKKIDRLKRIKAFLLLFIFFLFLSGLTAIPIDSELTLLLHFAPPHSALEIWLSRVLSGYQITKEKYPFLLYGYDWLAFAHFVLTILFVGPYKNPVRNIWIIEFGLIACVLVIPFAFVAGYFRGIPIGWRLIDCSFGVFAFALLWYCYFQLKRVFPSISKNKIHENF